MTKFRIVCPDNDEVVKECRTDSSAQSALRRLSEQHKAVMQECKDGVWVVSDLFVADTSEGFFCARTVQGLSEQGFPNRSHVTDQRGNHEGYLVNGVLKECLFPPLEPGMIWE